MPSSHRITKIEGTVALMAEKLALVVDDSKMARVVLSKMLKEQQIDVDQVESGEEALGYLCNHQPDMIFMDHTMPGMDGFQTLRAIRNDPRHAGIPIMMYTSKEGEVFVSQARALGAAAIIPKKRLRAEQLVSVLEGQNLLPSQSRGDSNAPANDGTLIASKIKEDAIVDFMEDDLQEVTKAVENSLRDRPEATPLRRMLLEFREQLSQDSHRDVDGVMMRLEEKLLHIDARLDQLQAEQQLAQQSQSSPRWLSFAALFLLGLTLWLAAALWNRTSPSASEKAVQLEEAISQQQASVEDNTSRLEQELKSLSYQNQKSMGQLYTLVGGVLSQHSNFAWNEVPFNDRLAGQMEDIANQLDTLGFRGVITLRSHLGKFCLQAKGNGQPMLPRDNAPASGCEVSELSTNQAEEHGLAQSMAFSNALAAIEARFGDDVKIELETAGTDEPLHDYPESTEGITAGAWNKIAARNQRLDISFNPR